MVGDTNYSLVRIWPCGYFLSFTFFISIPKILPSRLTGLSLRLGKKTEWLCQQNALAPVSIGWMERIQVVNFFWIISRLHHCIIKNVICRTPKRFVKLLHFYILCIVSVWYCTVLYRTELLDTVEVILSDWCDTDARKTGNLTWLALGILI